MLMRRKKQLYRVRLVAYDALPTPFRWLSLNIPSPDPTPFTVLLPSLSSLHAVSRGPRRIHLLYIQEHADTLFHSPHKSQDAKP